jgi:hypothetical protein
MEPLVVPAAGGAESRACSAVLGLQAAGAILGPPSPDFEQVVPQSDRG